MFGKIDSGGRSQGRQKRNRHNNISKERSSSQHTPSKRERPDKQGLSSQNANRSKKRRLPSEEALQLSDTLKKLSREKKLDEALTLFWDSSNEKVRDGHHACIMVDMAARCGKIAVRQQHFHKRFQPVSSKKFFLSYGCYLPLEPQIYPIKGRRNIVGKNSKRRRIHKC